MFIKLNQRPDHGFDEPLGLLSDCHRRIERFLGVMLAIAREREGGPLSAEYQRMLAQALEYFRAAGPRHTEDEEASLFPRLRAASGTRADEARAIMRRLDADHRAAEARHEAVDGIAARWLRQGTLPRADVRALLEHLEALESMYRAHIDVEDHQLFPTAGAILSEAEIEQIGQEMAERRGVSVQRHDATRGQR